MMHRLRSRVRALHPLAWLLPMAVAARLIAFAGRGDYVAFDEGWYLVLGRNLLAGDGFTLSGLRHVTLSPLFPILAGALDVILRDAIWSGRIVAALTSGLLVLPCWFIFRRISGAGTATLASLFVIALPALAPFAVPYWIGRDLWAGAEPLLHLFLFGGVALVLRARDTGSYTDWTAAGISFGLAYLARPEAVLVLGVLGLLLGGMALLARSRATVLRLVVLTAAFFLCAAPYWIYLHDVLGRWTLTGRGIEVSSVPARPSAAPSAAAETRAPGSTEIIERMLWGGDASLYVQRLYSLDRSGTRLASDYWGVPRDRVATTAVHAPSPLSEPVAPVDAGAVPAPAAASAPVRSSRPLLYARAIAFVLPWFTWPLVLLGVAAGFLLPKRRGGSLSAELLLVVPVLCTSVAIARVVAIDPRTQLLILPVAALYIARGVRFAAARGARPLRTAGVRRGFAAAALTGVLLTLLVGTQARWLYMGLAVGSPHHLAGESNRAIGAALREQVPGDGSVMSWHPAVALYARRDWRVLPHASLEGIVRYAHGAGSEYIVLSRFYPAPDISDELADRHIVLHVPFVPDGSAWRLHFTPGDGPFLHGALLPAGRSAAEVQHHVQPGG